MEKTSPRSTQIIKRRDYKKASSSTTFEKESSEDDIISEGPYTVPKKKLPRAKPNTISRRDPHDPDDSIKRSKSSVKHSEIRETGSADLTYNNNFVLLTTTSPRSYSARESEDKVRHVVGSEATSRSRTTDDLIVIRSSSDPAIHPSTTEATNMSSDDRPESQSKDTDVSFSDSDLVECQRYGIKTYDIDENTKMIYGGTFILIVNQLLEWIVTEHNRNYICKLISVFLFSYKKYAKAVDLLLHLLHCWKEIPPPHLGDKDRDLWIARRRTSVTYFFNIWFDLQYFDFEGRAFQILESFLEEIPYEFKKPLVAKIQNAMKSRPIPTLYLFEPSNEVKIKLEPGKFGFLDLKSRQIAEQWTLLDMRNFVAISRNEYIQLDKHNNPNWDRMLRRGCLLSRWVASEIVQNEKTAKRVTVIKRFINVVLRFLEMNNWNGAMCIWGGLNTVSVHRLQRTKKKLPQKTIEIWNYLEKRLSEENNFGDVRKAAKTNLAKGAPVVPWFELINKARNSACEYDDYLPTLSQNDPPLLNFSKMKMLGDQIQSFEKFKQSIENIDLYHDEDNKVDSIIRTYLEHLPTYPDDVLWKMSCRCESGD